MADFEEQHIDWRTGRGRAGRVHSGDYKGVHASAIVCARPECQQAAVAWAYDITGRDVTYTPDNRRSRLRSFLWFVRRALAREPGWHG